MLVDRARHVRLLGQSQNVLDRDQGQLKFLHGFPFSNNNVFTSIPTAGFPGGATPYSLYLSFTAAGTQSPGIPSTGIFTSLIGYDSLYAKDNSAYTRPWGADSTPYLMTGVNAKYSFTDRVSATLFVVNGYWHLADATFSAGTGMRLYLDGQLVASNAAVTSAQSYSGYLRIGYDNLTGWASAPTSSFFAGSLDEASAYSTVLTATSIGYHYGAGS